MRVTPSKPSIYTSLAPEVTKYGNDIHARENGKIVNKPLYLKFTKSMEKTNRIKKSSKLEYLDAQKDHYSKNGGNGPLSNVGSEKWENKMKLYVKMKEFGQQN